MRITREKPGAARLRELEALAASLLDAIPHAVIGLERRVFNFANHAVETVFGWRPEELLGRNTRLLYRTDAEGEEIARRVYTALEAQRTFSTEFPCRRRDGRDILCKICVSRIGETLQDQRIVVTYEDITAQVLAREELERSRKQLRDLSAHLQAVREEEQTRIAREIHDELGQLLTALKMDLSWLGSRLPAGLSPLREKTRLMTKLVDTTIDTVRRIAADLRPGLLDDLGLAAAIEWQAREFSRRSGIACVLDLDAEEALDDRDLATALFRIFQEVLTNVARHAAATEVRIGLRKRAKGVELEISDNGRGITRRQCTDPTSLGIAGMRERMHPWGGEVRIAGRRGRGTRVLVRVPAAGRAAGRPAKGGNDA